MANSTLVAADDRFGPFVEPLSHEQFDFTLLFEQSIFTLAPSALLLLAAPVRLFRLSQARRVVRHSLLVNVKLVGFAVLVVLHCVTLALWATSSHLRTRASVAAATLTLAAMLALSCLSYMEHVRSVRPSLVINAYLLLIVPLDFAQVRTLWLRHADTAVAVTYTSASAIKLALLAIEAVEKGRILLPNYKSSSPESTTGIYSRSLFWWLNPLFLLGHRRVLSNDTLFDIDDALSTDNVYPAFQSAWQKCSRVGGSYALVRAVATTMLLPLAAAVVPRAVVIFLRFMQPLLIRQVAEWVSRPLSEFTTNEGWGLTGAAGLIYAGLAISSAIYYHQVYRTITMIRGALVAAIYSKTLEVSTSAFNESAAVTLMSTDVQKICDALSQMHEVWASVIEIAIATWLLSQQIDFALLGPLLITIAAVLATMAVSMRMGPAQAAWMAAIQTRIDATAKVLESMKEVKMLGLTPTISTVLRKLRTREIAKSLKSRRLLAVCITLGNVSSTLGPGMAFIIYVTAANRHDEPLNVPQAFTALSLITLLSAPVSTLIFAFPPLLEALACARRIQQYLLSDERNDHRNILDDKEVFTPSRLGPTDKNRGDVELQPIRSVTSGRRSHDPVAQLTNVSLAWKEEDLPVIKDISFQLAQCSITFIIGPVGCGKTTLLQGMLGEIVPRTGNVHGQSANAAYVAQTPWVQDDSLRNNILGVSALEPEWYDTVIQACVLVEDIANLPHGDQTKVGSAGGSLSGGQKLRVALARAVYSRPRLLLIDDCFSGVDAKTEDAIFTRLFGQRGLLRRLGATVLLSTHATHRLSFADHIIALSPDGAVAEEGAFSTLINKGGYVSSLVVRHKAETEHTATNGSETPPRKKDLQSSEGIVPDQPSRVMGDLQVYKHYFGAAGWSNSGMFFLLIMSFAFFSRFSDFWMVLWTSAVQRHGNSVNDAYLGAFVTFGAVALLSVLGVATKVFTSMVPTSAKNLHEGLLKTVTSAPLHFFTSTHTGQTLNRFSQDLSLVDSELPTSLIQVTGPLCLVIIQTVFICLSAAYFAAILPVVVAVLYLLQKYYLRTSKQVRLLDLEAKAPLFSHFLETMQGLVTIRAFGWQDNFTSKHTTLLDKSQKPFYLMYCIQRWLSLVLDLIVAALAVILMIMIVKLREHLDSGFVALALLNVMSLNNNLTAIIQMWTGLETSMGAIARLKDFQHRTPSEILAQETARVPASWPSSGAVTFSNLSAAYSPGSFDVLHHIDLTIQPGEKIGICGATGSGKSSLLACLCRMLEITDGAITIDGLDLATIPRQTIRERISAIPQHGFWLNGATLRDNLDPTGHSSDAAIEAALREVGLHDILLPPTDTSASLASVVNLDTALSHGQRQLFSLARALLHHDALSRSSFPSSSSSPGSHHQIVILDEPTASVDAATDARMQAIIRRRFADATLLVVAHRLATITDGWFDRVVVMHGGKVVEVGRSETLLEDGQGWLRGLWDA